MVPISHIGLKRKLTKRKIKNHKKVMQKLKKKLVRFLREKKMN